MKLEGIKVLDLSMCLPGPLLTQMMADHGAEVIKLETVGEGEPNRHIGLQRDGVSVFFANTHRGKKSLTLNLKSEEGHEIFMKLAEEADVIIEAFPVPESPSGSRTTNRRCRASLAPTCSPA